MDHNNTRWAYEFNQNVSSRKAVSQFLLIAGECLLDGHASLMIDILTVYIFSISTYTLLKINVHEGLF